MTQICRLCLKTSLKHNYKYISVNQTDNNGVAIATLIKTLLPELYLGLSLHPVICQPCYDALRDAYSFRLQCLRSENLIGIYMRETHCNSASSTIVLQDVIDYWMDVYKNKQCQTAVARDNLEEWFGVDTSHICPETDRSRTKPNTTDKKRMSREEAESNKKIEQSPLIEPNIISSRDLIELLQDNYRVEVEEIESDVEEEKSSSRTKQDATEIIENTNVKNSVPENEVKPAGTPDTPKDSGQGNSQTQTDSQETCGCPPAGSCPASNLSKWSLARKRYGSHHECMILCKYRHLKHCKYSRAPEAVKVVKTKIVPQSAESNSTKGCIKEVVQAPPAFPPPVKTYTKKIKASEDEVVEKPKEDARASASLLIDDIDENNLFEELQKCYDAGKFGFSENVSNLKECFVLKKFFDATDNSFSYALLPKASEGDPSTSNTEGTEPLSSLSDAYMIFKSRDLIDGEKLEESEGGETKITCKGINSLLEFNNALVGPSQGNPVPIIRVRPVSTLQKVRTLNHELFPLSVETERKEATPAPRTVAQPVRPVPALTSTTPPLVLNSTMVSSLKNVLIPIKCPSPPPPNESLKTVMKTYSKPLKVVGPPRLSPILKNSQQVVETDNDVSFQFVHHVSAGKITEVALTASETNEKNTAVPANEEDVIDIKEEPLDYADNEFSNVGEDLSNGADWSGETTRSSSETSLMDKLMNDNISQLIENIPDVGEEFDEPEYVHINKVSFADLTKMVKESKQMKDELKQKLENKTLGVNPLQTSSTPKPRLRRVGKRVRIVPVGADGKKVAARKIQRTLVKTFERTVSDPNCNSKDVCVLFTSFTSEGDYINDHDYLISPYTRNNMSIGRKTDVTCACLLCNITHSAAEHISHMKCHGTKCEICQVDFHNVFILNLHVRAHVSYCKLCRVAVTYSRYLHHAVSHNRLLARAKLTDGEKKEDGSTAKPLRKMGRQRSPRRSRRLTSVKNYEGMELDEEEACIYDKTTKSFVTPSGVKQEKLLEEQCNDANKTENTKPPKDDNGDEALKFVNLADLKPNTANINVNFSNAVEDSKNAVPQNAAPRKSRWYSGRRKRKYKRKRAEHPDGSQQQSSDANVTDKMRFKRRKTETTVKIEEGSANEAEETATKRKKLDGESECERLSGDINNGSLQEESTTRRLSLRRRCPRLVPKNSSIAGPRVKSSKRQRRTKAGKAKNVHQNRSLLTTSCLPSESSTSDLAAAVDAIISSPKILGKLSPKSLELAESPVETREKLKVSWWSVSTETRSSRSRGNVNLVEGMQIHTLAKIKKARKSISPAPAPSNQEEIAEGVNLPEPPLPERPSTQSPSVDKSTTSLEKADMDQCGDNSFVVVPSVDVETSDVQKDL